MDSYERFEELLNINHKTAYAVSKATGISTVTLSNWKNGKYTPKQEKMQILADYFNVSVSYLMNGKEEEKKPLPEYDPDFIKVIDMYSKLNDEQKEIIKNMMKVMVK